MSKTYQKAEFIFTGTLKKIELHRKYTDAPIIDQHILYVMAKQAAVFTVNQLINEHTTRTPSRTNIERHNFFVKVLKELEENF